MRARGSDRWLAVLASLRTTAALLLLLLVLLVLSVLIPQRSGVTLAAHDAWAAAGGIRRFLLIDLELGHVPTSRIFLASLGLFFANLLAVLGERTGVALRRCRFIPPTAAAARELSRRDDAIAIAASEGGMSRAAAVLRGLGYRTVSAEGRVWGVKNRFSPLGFPLFHLSFFVLWAAGSLLYYTRSVGILSAIEGQWVETASAHVVTRAPAGPPPSLRLQVERVDLELKGGAPTALEARIRAGDGNAPSQGVRVNSPLVIGATSVLVERAGIAPVLRVEDERGFTVERLALTARSDPGGAARASVAGGAFEVEVEPLPVGPGFPQRGALPAAKISLHVRTRDGRDVAARLAPGQGIELPSGRIVVEEVRYWVALRVVHERGGWLLILGFAIGVVGIVARMLWYRRELVVLEEGGVLRFAGRAEFFQDRFAAELESVVAETRRGEARARPS